MSRTQKRLQFDGKEDRSGSVDTTKLQLANKDYTVGWICAISTEYVAARAFLDKEHEGPENQASSDHNDYTLGEIGKHNVVIAVLPDGEYGTASAAVVARDMLHSFTNIRIGLMIGVGGGAPSAKHDIRLGDIVVSSPRDGNGGVLQYDFGKAIQNRKFQTTGFSNQPPTILRTAVNRLKARYESDGHHFEHDINKVLQTKPRLQSRYSRPTSDTDRLYEANVVHEDQTCCVPVDGICGQKFVLRTARTDFDDNPAIHYGLIASANRLMKDALVRDALAAEKGVLCFEMEAAGLMNHFPCLVIRGICDYSDSHKNKDWQGYAAMSAAAYGKDLLCCIPPSKVEAEKKINEVLLGIQGSVENLVQNQQGKEHESMLNWLTPIDYGPQQRDNIQRRQPGTGQWLLASEEYRHWLQTKKQTLFCPGIPGAGKTILASIVINELDDYVFHSQGTVGLAYVYLNFKRTDDQKIEDLICSLLKQLSQGLHPLPRLLNDLYDRGKRTRPPLEAFIKALHSVASMYSRVFIIIDALDECQESSGCREQFLSAIFNLQSETEANIFTTSRFIMNITERFESSTVVEVRASEEDIIQYLSGNMSRLSGCVKRDPVLQSEVKSSITMAVEGMFLLAHLHFESLMGLDTPKAVRKALKALTTGYNTYDLAYSDAMSRVQSQNPRQKERALQVLQWVTCTKRPLTPSELQHALGIEPDTQELDEDNLPQIEDVVSVCAGLVTIDKVSGIIRLVHYTTQEYFDRTRSMWFPNAEHDISASCITYLSFRDFESGHAPTDEIFENRLACHPFYDYATRNWGHHARDALSCPNIMSFLKNQTLVEASIQAPFAVHGWPQWVPKKITGLHLAAYFGLVEIVPALIPIYGTNTKDSWDRTPLSYCAQHGHISTIQLLLSQDADIETKDNEGQTPLQWAAKSGHVATVRLLVDEGASIETRDSGGQTPLSQAAYSEHHSTIELLLDRGADIETKDGGGRTPLLWAAWAAVHEATIELLLDRGANIEAKDDDGHTPLAWAAQTGHRATIQLLLARGADIETKDFGHRTPLLWAAPKCDEAVIQLLLDQGADINTKDTQGRTPLSWAAQNPLEVAIQLLLDRGADIETTDDDGHTPLSWAARDGHEANVQLLLDRGADIKTKNKLGETPLSWAARYGREATVQLLVDQGADINTQDSQGRTPFSLAAQAWSEANVQLMLEQGADIKTQDNQGRTPLLWAARYGRLAIAHLLLDRGADMETKDNRGRTPLSLAAQHGWDSTVQLLLDRGADIKTEDSLGRTPLSWAAQTGHEAIIRLLLDLGSDVKAKDNEGRTPLSWLAEGGLDSTIQSL